MLYFNFFFSDEGYIVFFVGVVVSEIEFLMINVI